MNGFLLLVVCGSVCADVLQDALNRRFQSILLQRYHAFNELGDASLEHSFARCRHLKLPPGTFVLGSIGHRVGWWFLHLYIHMLTHNRHALAQENKLGRSDAERICSKLYIFPALFDS